MSNNITIKFNDVEYNAGDNASFIADICETLPEEGADSLLVALAGHSSSRVGCSIARRDKLPIEALITLAESKNLSVRRELIRSDAFRAWATTDLLVEWSQVDEEFARCLAESLGYFDAADTEVVFKTLAAHDDTDVRRGLAESYNLPKRLWRLLLDDVDMGVRNAAENSLS